MGSARAQRTVGDMVYEALKCGERRLLDKNSACLRKVCELCFRHVCLVEYHVRAAERVAEVVGAKLRRAHDLLAGNAAGVRGTRALSARTSRSSRVNADLVDMLRVQREARLFNKRKGEWGRIGWTGLGASEVFLSIQGCKTLLYLTLLYSLSKVK